MSRLSGADDDPAIRELKNKQAVVDSGTLTDRQREEAQKADPKAAALALAAYKPREE